MSLESFANKWFVIYYVGTGLCLIGAGLYLTLKNNRLANSLARAAEHDTPPKIFIRILKYFLLFTLPGLVLSFTPFSWTELLFTLWGLLLVYLAGIQLVRWDQNRSLIRAKSQQLPDLIRRSGAIMLSVGFAIILLAYLVIKRTSL